MKFPGYKLSNFLPSRSYRLSLSLPTYCHGQINIGRDHFEQEISAFWSLSSPSLSLTLRACHPFLLYWQKCLRYEQSLPHGRERRRKGGSFMRQTRLHPFSSGKSWYSEPNASSTQAMDPASVRARPEMHTINGYVNRSLPGMYVRTCSRILRVFSMHYQSSFLHFSDSPAPQKKVQGILASGGVLKYSGWFLFQLPKNEGLPMYTQLTDFSCFSLK